MHTNNNNLVQIFTQVTQVNFHSKHWPMEAGGTHQHFGSLLKQLTKDQMKSCIYTFILFLSNGRCWFVACFKWTLVCLTYITIWYVVYMKCWSNKLPYYCMPHIVYLISLSFFVLFS